MRRYSEVVFNGHPDKFCDLLADRIIRDACRNYPEAYGQVEASVWSDQIFLTGAVALPGNYDPDIRSILTVTGLETGYLKDNHIDVMQYELHDHICRLNEDPAAWTLNTNDQSVIHGYAGYDAKTRFLPPEHFAAWFIRERVMQELKDGILKGHGPDGKLLVVTGENRNEWHIQNLLLTLQQKEETPFLEFSTLCAQVLKKAGMSLMEHDPRWIVDYKGLRLLINPNGPFTRGGSDGDNGQTGRKLVMDFYGPRVPIGGGAIYGKDLSHIDRAGSFAARQFAIDLVENGADEAFVSVCFAPGIMTPMDISIRSSVRPHTDAYAYFDFREIRKSMNILNLEYDPVLLGTFYNSTLGFNNKSTASKMKTLVPV